MYFIVKARHDSLGRRQFRQHSGVNEPKLGLGRDAQELNKWARQAAMTMAETGHGTRDGGRNLDVSAEKLPHVSIK